MSYAVVIGEFRTRRSPPLQLEQPASESESAQVLQELLQGLQELEEVSS